ncbi:MAG: hypothetical protein IJ303_05245 [Clostridia bacterium]|nr:hypothetical protein [Clostridia bacterium]
MKKCILFLCLFCILSFCLIFFSYAAKGDIIEGQVICDADVDLSNIKFDIDLLSKSGNCHPSTVVYTNKEGKFSFAHPGGDSFYCAVNIDSLPFGYGSKQLGISEKSTRFSEMGLVLELTKIDSISVSYSGGGGVSYSIRDKEGDVIYCKTEITTDECVSFENITYEELKLLARLPRSGHAIAGGRMVEWSGYDAIGADPIDMKMGKLYSDGYISLDKYYDLWLDWREDAFGGTVFMCGNPIMAMEETILDYADQTKNAALKERIITLLGSDHESLQQFDEEWSGVNDTEKTESENWVSKAEKTVIQVEQDKQGKTNFVWMFVLGVLCAALFFAGVILEIVIYRKRISRG